jgi:hypothetical protein
MAERNVQKCTAVDRRPLFGDIDADDGHQEIACGPAHGSQYMALQERIILTITFAILRVRPIVFDAEDVFVSVDLTT